MSVKAELFTNKIIVASSDHYDTIKISGTIDRFIVCPHGEGEKTYNGGTSLIVSRLTDPPGGFFALC